MDFINIDWEYDDYSKVLQELLAEDIILLNAIIYDGKIYFAGHDGIDLSDDSDEDPIFDYVDENIVMTLDTYANMAVVTATDEKGRQRQYAGFAYAPLNADGAKKHPVNGGDDDGKNGTEGDPEYVPGLPETPDHPGTPGGGEDPLGPVYEKNAHLTIYKTVSSTTVNGEFYEVGETIQYVITVTNDGERYNNQPSLKIVGKTRNTVKEALASAYGALIPR